MKTLHLHRHAPPTPRTLVGPTTVRLGVVVSIAAALAAVVLETVADVPAAFLLVPVVIVGSVLSWHASGRMGEPPVE
jgi:hypothetical protein